MQAAALPEWVVWIQALAPAFASMITAFVAIAVGVIAFRQWVTAHRKLKLDLFQARYAVYEDLMRAVLEIPEALSAGQPAAVAKIAPKLDMLRYAMLRADMLFPEVVTKRIPAIDAEAKKALKLASKPRQSDAGLDLLWIGSVVEIAMDIGSSGKLLAEAMKPYLRIHEKL